MRALGPEFVDITWYDLSLLLAIARIDSRARNAGGRTSELTSELVKTCQSLIGIETCMHLTCTNMPKEKVDIALRVRPCMRVKYVLPNAPDDRKPSKTAAATC